MAKREQPVSQLADAISHMSDSQVQCRDFGHSWRPYTAEWIPQHRHYVETLRCSRCRSFRLRLLGEYGELLGNRYHYSDNYLVHGMGRLDEDDRNELRLSSLHTVLSMVEGQTRKAG